MLPFLKHSQEVGSSSSVEAVMRKSDDEDKEFDSLESAAEDLMNAVHSKDIKAIASALRAAFELMENEPHSEGSEDESRGNR